MKRFVDRADLVLAFGYDPIEINYEDLMETRLEEGKIPSSRVGTNDEGEQEVTEPILSDGQFPNDNNIVQRVEGSKNGIGFFGYSYFKENEGDLKALAVYNPETGKCVKPSDRTIQNGTYPISRTLYIYPNNEKATSNEAVKAYLDFYMTEATLTDVVTESGYVPLHEQEMQESIDAWKALG